MLNFCDFIEEYVFTTNHHLKLNQIGQVGTYLACGHVGKYKYLQLNLASMYFKNTVSV